MRLRHPIRVRYAETDQMGVVHHAAYVVWLEEARTVWLEALGFPYHELEQEGLFFPVVDVGLTYRCPVRYGQVVEVETWLGELASRRVGFFYRVEVAGRLAAEGRSVHVPQDERGRTRRLPEPLFSRLKAARVP